jgi:hypothetical protein
MANAEYQMAKGIYRELLRLAFIAKLLRLAY